MSCEVVITRTWDETPEIRCFELSPANGTALPAAEPGAHIDVHLSPSLIRQYSLWNGPSDRDSYFIGVKREPQSRGGSERMHGLAAGDRLTIGAPRNNFPLVADARPALLLAGGIGITPLLSMARHLEVQGRAHELHVFARSEALTPFAALAQEGRMIAHAGLVPPALDGVLLEMLAARRVDCHVYVCGPAPFMELVRRLAAGLDWPEDQLHLEYFSAAPLPADAVTGAFEVEARRSGRCVWVGEDQTMAQALIDAGVDLLTSCEQGVCGTCVTPVLEGEPDHRDNYFSAAERASGRLVTPCVSRCKGRRLVLDL